MNSFKFYQKFYNSDVLAGIKVTKHENFIFYSITLADGRWYHRNFEAGFNGQDKIKYHINGEMNGKPYSSKGN